MIPKKLFFLFSFIIIASCLKAQDKLPDFDLGTVEDGVYTNKFFNCRLAIPKGWFSEIDEDQKLQKVVLDEVSNENPEYEAAIEAARIKSAILIVITKYQKGAPVAFNPNIILLIENVSEFPGIKTGADYLFQAVKLIKLASPDAKIKSKEFERHDFSRVFYSCLIGNQIYGMKFKQKMFSTIIDDYSFTMSCTYKTKAEFQELYDVISKIEFEN